MIVVVFVVLVVVVVVVVVIGNLHVTVRNVGKKERCRVYIQL